MRQDSKDAVIGHFVSGLKIPLFSSTRGPRSLTHAELEFGSHRSDRNDLQGCSLKETWRNLG
jgi:hypothetical protein